jgi:hypothetical protein
MTSQGHARPDDEPGRPAKQDGQSMAYQLTPLGISVSAQLRAHPMHAYEMFPTLVEWHADRIVKVRRGHESSLGPGGSTGRDAGA